VYKIFNTVESNAVATRWAVVVVVVVGNLLVGNSLPYGKPYMSRFPAYRTCVGGQWPPVSHPLMATIRLVSNVWI